jgi:predicted Zn-dependent protease
MVPLPGPQVYGDRPARWFADTAELAAEAVADDVARVVAAAGDGLRASGLFQVGQWATAIANSRGLCGWDAETGAEYSTTVHGSRGSGKAVQSQSSHGRIDVAELARTAVENARMSQDPGPVEAGDHTVVFEPLAVRGLLSLLPWALDAREADEGASPFAQTVGTALVSPLATISLETDDPELPAPTMGRHGEAARATRWIDRGTVRRLAHDRYWASRKATSADPCHSPLFVSGGASSVGDLVAGCERGLLVKDLWYIRNVDWRSFTLTGMTRDGVFLIEDGRVVRPVQNLRWNESPLVFLRNLVALSRAVRVGPGWKVPGAMSRGFTFTSATDSV